MYQICDQYQSRNFVEMDVDEGDVMKKDGELLSL